MSFPGGDLPILRVAEVGVHARAALRDGQRGYVVAVFERSAYFLIGGDWICIGARELGSGPLHVLCETRLPRWLSTGQDVTVVGSTLHVADRPLASFAAASHWTPPPPPDWTPDSLAAGLRAVDDVWRRAPAEEGLAAFGRARVPASLSRLCEAAAPGIAALAEIVEVGLGGCVPASPHCSEIAGLIGLGPGLTPSGDDLILGALVALAGLGFHAARDTLWQACREQLGRTNDISAAHLRSAALGCGAAALHAALHATMSGRAELIAPALAAVSRIGHSSGRDAFAGVLIVLRAVERHLAGSAAHTVPVARQADIGLAAS